MFSATRFLTAAKNLPIEETGLEAWVFGILPKVGDREEISYLFRQDGIMAMYPSGGVAYVLYKTLNDAKRSRNVLRTQGYKVTEDDILRVFLNEEKIVRRTTDDRLKNYQS